MKAPWRSSTPFGTLVKKARENKHQILKLYFMVGSVIVLGLFIFINNQLVNSAKNEAKTVPNLFAHFVKYSTFDNETFHSLLTDYILNDIIQEIDYPVIVTDSDLIPQYWKNLSIEPTKKYKDLTSQEQKIVDAHLTKMQEKYKGIPIILKQNKNKILGYTFYNDSKTVEQLKIMPFIEAGILVLFISIGVYALFLIKNREKDKVWVGLAKETAHQFGTPISSLLGWIDLLKMQIEDEDMQDGLNMMEEDVTRLQKVASRFGKVGSNIKLKKVKIHNLIEEIINYFELRVKNQSTQINFHFISKIEDLEINIDEDLIAWAFENLIKNSLDAMTQYGGNIIISAALKDRKLHFLIKDEGKGMPKSMHAKIFKPGVTTKKRGWGLGLSLTKRIIEDYHNGKIAVLLSKKGEGTIFEIMLPEE